MVTVGSGCSLVGAWIIGIVLSGCPPEITLNLKKKNKKKKLVCNCLLCKHPNVGGLVFTDCADGPEVRVRSPVGITLSLPFLSFKQLTDYITHTSLFCSALKHWEEINLSKWFFLILKVAQWCPTLCNPMDYNSPWNSPGQNTGVVALSFSRGPSQPRDGT